MREFEVTNNVRESETSAEHVHVSELILLNYVSNISVETDFKEYVSLSVTRNIFTSFFCTAQPNTQ